MIVVLAKYAELLELAVAQQLLAVDYQVAGVEVSPVPVEAVFLAEIFLVRRAQGGAGVHRSEIAVPQILLVVGGEVLAEDDVHVRIQYLVVFGDEFRGYQAVVGRFGYAPDFVSAHELPFHFAEADAAVGVDACKLVQLALREVAAGAVQDEDVVECVGRSTLQQGGDAHAGRHLQRLVEGE